ncbi:potassium channel family protein [Chondrinema litorale]|uniref:potassium channel family protein n=1 Tax=Chondrinema litorale TaxID=2994555 RepID=UPI0025427D54|nr:potassium channel protein [Chondrinema litorale]UZR94873.1 potassium channel protein [Chondrinema litorale]
MSLFVGISGLMIIENLSFWKAFYLSVIIISTVGMNEVGTVSEGGRIFISFYIIFNLSIFAYFVSVITKYIFEGELREIFKSYMVSRVADKLQNHTIVCGYGKNGTKACEELYRSRVPFVLIEMDAEVVDDTYENARNVFILQGDATSDDILLAAGIEKAKTIITTLPKDADNVFVSLTARELNPKITIVARASEESSVSKLKRAGAHHVVMPDAIGGHHMATLVTRPEVVEFLGMLNGMGNEKLELDEIRFEDMKDEFHGKTLKEMNIREKTGVNILGYKDPEKGFVFNPHPNTVFKQGAVAIVLGDQDELKKFMSYCSKNYTE